MRRAEWQERAERQRALRDGKDDVGAISDLAGKGRRGSVRLGADQERRSLGGPVRRHPCRLEQRRRKLRVARGVGPVLRVCARVRFRAGQAEQQDETAKGQDSRQDNGAGHKQARLALPLVEGLHESLKLHLRRLIEHLVPL